MDTLHTVILIVHVLGASLVLGFAFFTVLLVLRKGLGEQTSLLEFIQGITPTAIVIQTLTGLYLAFADWDTISRNPLFWTKLALFIVDGILIQILIRWKLRQADPNNRNQAFSLIALASLLIVLLIASLSVVLANP